MRRLAALFTLCCATLVLTSGGLGLAAREPAPVSEDIAGLIRRSAPRVRALVMGEVGPVLSGLRSQGLGHGRVLGRGVVVEASAAQIDELRTQPGVTYITLDLPVSVAMATADQAVGGDQVRAGGLGRTGRGIGVAVLDSGMATHSALRGKVRAEISFVQGEPHASDGYGHGTHVAGMVAGLAPTGRVTHDYRGGIAPGAHLVNVKVLNASGFGFTSDVVAGLEWVIANRAALGIRVVNLSLGRPVRESCVVDPLCQAVGRAVAAGLVVVASAGNAGVSPTGEPVLGGIASPGNSPHALTVGAVNGRGTVDRRDDTVATYSSRGPTAFDLAVKPDVVAPGNRIVSLAAADSLLVLTFPEIVVAGRKDNAYARLSGTSMAAAIVSGAVALLLEGAPGLTPQQVKLALQATSSLMPDAGLMAAGAGLVNVAAASQVTQRGLTLPLPGTLVAGVPVVPGGVAFWDGGGLAAGVIAGTGLRVVDLATAVAAWGDPAVLRYADLNVFGLVNPVALLPPNRLLWGEVASWTAAPALWWGTPVTNPEGQNVVWGNGSDNVVWGYQGDNVVWGYGGKNDNVVWGNSQLPVGDPPQ
ncbi:MAG: S8 family serine peptidase [Acidobacteriota bacterium]